MRVYLTRHGQTDLNKGGHLQGRTDEPLNEAGKAQAIAAGEKLKKISFDAVYASPLSRAVETAALMSGVSRETIIRDPRLLEVDFGRFDRKRYFALPLSMMMFWICPELFPAPETVETVPEMLERTRSFLQDLKKTGCRSVLIVCHGGIMRVLSGQLEHRKNGIKWRPRPKNAEIRVYEL